MSRLSLFNSPLLLGFEHFERTLDRVNKVSGDGYPPYNVEQLGENELRITLAVAGFTMADLGITIEDNQLVICVKQTDDTERVYLHSVISGYICQGGCINPCTGQPEQYPFLYFRPCINTTRGQTAKIVANTFYPACQTPQRR